MTPGIDRRSPLHTNPSVIGIDYLFVDTATQPTSTSTSSPPRRRRSRPH